MQKITAGGSTFYRYYKPMKVGGLCLNCHGDKAAIDQQVLALLREHYPDDEATGYAPGDFRGLISVTVRREL